MIESNALQREFVCTQRAGRYRALPGRAFALVLRIHEGRGAPAAGMRGFVHAVLRRITDE
ncbi:MAG: hypothetical protein ISP90_11955 [Nevskia sp.]|nr:hypothetical protein [Nevskia sp.]